MKKIHIITPVKDSIELTLITIKAIMASKISAPHLYTVYNDFSTPENTGILKKASEEFGFKLVNLADLTNHPSPNYLLVLQTAQQKALEEDAALCIIESDVVVKQDTIQSLFDGALQRPDCGIAAAVTVDKDEHINFPYLYAKGKENQCFPTRKHLSFCCSLLTLNLLKKYNFSQLNPQKNWYDVTISHQSLKEGLVNYLFTTLTVLHQPHGSRPWKMLKYTNPLKYYWLKIINKRDQI